MTTMSEDLRRSYRTRARALETSLRHLISEVLDCLPPAAQRDYRRRLGARVDVLFGDFDRALHDDLTDSEFQQQADRILDASDRMIEVRAEMERLLRHNRDTIEDLDRAAQRRKLERLEREGRAAAGGAVEPEL